MVLSVNKISAHRRYCPQLLACCAKTATLMNHTLVLSLPTIVIPALTGLSPANNPNEHLSITPEEASWIASIYASVYVIGALMSNFLDPLGRKKSLMLGNIPYFICWLSFYYSSSLQAIYITLAVMGIASGLLEAPIVLYLSEISEPNTRTFLLVATNFTHEIGAALIYFLSNQMPWRDATLVCSGAPIVAILITMIIPETPQWLLSRGRTADALKSLQWFRGWTEPGDVQIEFENLQRYKAVAYVCYDCEKQRTECKHPQPKLSERLHDILRRKTIIPLFIVVCLCSNTIFGGAVLRPFLVPILKSFKSPIDPNGVLVWVGYAGLVANIGGMIVIRLFGRRIIHLFSLASSFLILYALGAYGFLQSSQCDFVSNLKYFPVVALLLLLFLQNLGLRNVSNLLMTEVFSYRTKSLATGIALAIFFISLSVTAKTFHLLQAAITLPGQCVLYGTIGAVGFVIIYLMLPEIEGRTLEDIEMYFSDKRRKFNDIHIPEIAADQKRITIQ